MKSTLFICTLCLITLFSYSCDTCPDGHVEVPEDVESYPDLSWTVEVGSRYDPAISTALTIYTDPANTITLSGTDTAWVKFEARDTINGILRADVEGGFGITCSSDSSAIVVDGIYPSAPEENPLSDGCAPIAHTFSNEFVITSNGVCSGMNPNVTAGTWQLRGSATNHGDFSSSSTLTINWAP